MPKHTPEEQAIYFVDRPAFTSEPSEMIDAVPAYLKAALQIDDALMNKPHGVMQREFGGPLTAAYINRFDPMTIWLKVENYLYHHKPALHNSVAGKTLPSQVAADTTSELDEYLGPRKDAAPVKPPHWTDIKSARGEFWARVSGDLISGFNVLGIPMIGRETMVRDIIGSRLHDTRYTKLEAIDAVLKELAIKYLQPTPANGTNGAASNEAVFGNADEVKEETTVTDKTVDQLKQDWLEWLEWQETDREQMIDVLNDHLDNIGSRRRIKSLTEWSDFDEARAILDAYRKSLAPTAEPSNDTPLYEAPFSSTFKMIDTHGIEVSTTIRAANETIGDAAVERAIENKLKRGYTANRQPTGNAGAPAQSPVTSAANSTSGVASCVLISVGLSYEGSKPQLSFDCDGWDKPLRFTQGPDKMARLLQGIRKPDGTPFTPADLTNGRKFAGQWNVSWSKPGQYYNVDAVNPA